MASAGASSGVDPRRQDTHTHLQTLLKTADPPSCMFVLSTLPIKTYLLAHTDMQQYLSIYICLCSYIYLFNFKYNCNVANDNSVQMIIVPFPSTDTDPWQHK